MISVGLATQDHNATGNTQSKHLETVKGLTQLCLNYVPNFHLSPAKFIII